MADYITLFNVNLIYTTAYKQTSMIDSRRYNVGICTSYYRGFLALLSHPSTLIISCIKVVCALYLPNLHGNKRRLTYLSRYASIISLGGYRAYRI